MGLTFAVNELPTSDLRQKVEASLRQILGSRPEDEASIVWIHASISGLYYSVVLERPGLKREQIFYEKANALPEAIANWVRLYLPRLK